MIQTFPNITGNGELLIKIVRLISGHPASQSMIDLCCAHATCSSRVGFGTRKYVDIQPWQLDDGDEQRFFVQENALEQKGSFDVALCADGIEHFKKEDGYELIRVMQSLAPIRIVFTPLGEYKVGPIKNTVDDHKSGWYPDDVPDFESIVFPNWHPTLNAGAFFFFQCPDVERVFDSTVSELTCLL